VFNKILRILDIIIILKLWRNKMNVLVINCGSSSLKYQLINMDDESVLAKGLVERIGIDGSLLKHERTGLDKLVIEEDLKQ
jgi:acetate kinase